uniref:RING-type domain-containing protein n=1 Tax=Chromera velia CCMP2878 TaxID=1169474 RepID=A0A0G4GCK2_9ALVE|eukprot:Cvel_21256.t1-p1 / transcript=Cvel_21256.t1 / gene=Cvel_21256 / organism=Chromera_velia_CCMP2878 / gene_product=TNF receptor-associated factor 4, putative / transcript_product=TNF receptor-associated factor 4, putative / location=Cvel_scaffold1977:21520-23298(+) / protein_length=277 / sequence_SO=supercontig / SO=protein_coding / is_pseudo=false
MSSSSASRRLGLDVSFAAEGFEDLVKEALCPVCFEYMDDAAEADCRSHVYCRPCLQTVLDERRPCPECRYPVTKIVPAHVRIRSMIERVKWKCLNYKRGCEFIGTKKELEKHLQEDCEKQETECPFEGCEEKNLPSRILEHRKVCPFRSVPCEHCAEIVSLPSMVAHLSVCTKVPVPCPNFCGRNPERGQISLHLETECAESLVPCEVPGCETRVKRKEMEEHEVTNVHKHVKLMTARVLANEVTKTTADKDVPQGFPLLCVRVPKRSLGIEPHAGV